MRTLDEIALETKTDKSSGFHKYCPIYESYFSELRDKPIFLVEIGVQFGLSIKMWAEYFQLGEIFGVDIIDNFKSENPRVHLAVGNGADQEFWKTFHPEVMFDIVIDDGSHKGSDQIPAFNALWPRVKPGGYFVIEDVFTAFDSFFDSPESLRQWLDYLFGNLNRNGRDYHGKPMRGSNVKLETIEKEIEFIHLYYGLIIIRKKA